MKLTTLLNTHLILKLFLLFSILIAFSCSDDKSNPSTTEPDPLEKVEYNFWDFNGNGENAIDNAPAWETVNILFSDSTLISNGIYENSGENNAEKAVVQVPNLDINKHSIAVRFYAPSSLLNEDWGSKPILVGSRLWRWISVEMSKQGNLSIIGSGNEGFAVPNSTMNVTEINFQFDKFNTLYISWDFENHEIYIALNNDSSIVTTFPTNFKWENYDPEWTLQHYGRGSAFTGEIDYILDANAYLSREEMNVLIGRHH